MTLETRDQYKTSPKGNLRYVKTASRTTVAASWFTLFDLAGGPGAGSLAVGNTANGVVPVQGATGYPSVQVFASGGCELGRIKLDCNVACRVKLFDNVFSAGSYAFNAGAVSLTSQPSYSTRVPQGYAGETELWYEQVTASTGNPTITGTYTDQDGNASASTGAVAFGLAPTLGRCIQLPFAGGDSGMRLLSGVSTVGTAATVGTFNVRVLRPLWTGRVNTNGFYVETWLAGARKRFQDRPALFALISSDSTSSGVPDLDIELCDG